MRKLYRHLFLYISFLFISTLVSAQNCVILSKDESCLGDFMGFSVQSNGTPTTYDWDFGDGSTSSVPQPTHTYSTPGTKAVKVRVTFANGNTCDGSKTVVVFHKPIADFTIDSNSNYCIYKNRICIKDVSKPGLSGNPLVKRLILWGDGDTAGGNYPNVPQNSCHKYTLTANYTILIEVTDSKGCYTKKSVSVPILPDLKSDYIYSTSTDPRTCKVKTCITNTSDFDTANFKDHRWVVMGNSFDTSFKQLCYETDTNVSFPVTLIMNNKNGCTDTFTDTVRITIPVIEFDITIPDQVCLGSTVLIQNRINNNPAEYGWFIKDSSTNIEKLWTTSNSFTYNFKDPGKYYFKQTIKKGGCVRSWIDSIDVIGPLAKFRAFNRLQCSPSDSVIFCDSSSNGFKSYNVIRLWDFKYGDMCTTDVLRGLNLGKNCRWSNDTNVKHWYDYTTPGLNAECFDPELKLLDTVTGCSSVFMSKVLLGLPPKDSIKLNYTVTQPCTDKTKGNLLRQYDFTFDNFTCQSYWESEFIYDSTRLAATKTPFSGKPRLWIYDTIIEVDGLLTVGAIFSNGGTPRYINCSQVAGSYARCADTVWYHDFVRIYKEPVPAFSAPVLQGCVPHAVEFSWKDSMQRDIDYLFVNYDFQGKTDTFFFQPGDSVLPKLRFTYTDYGQFAPFTIMRNAAGCQNSFQLQLAVGYYNSFLSDSTICKGQTVQFFDSVRYFSIANLNDTFWRDTGRTNAGLESLTWDFDDGKGFITLGATPFHTFNDTGTFFIAMASKDSGLCRDTFIKKLYVTGIDAKIYSGRDTFFCNDNIIQFFDSTHIAGNYDSVKTRLWEFDDDKTPRTVQNPSYYFNSYGKKNVRLIINTVNGCSDTTYKSIFIKGPQPAFEFDSDSVGCVPLRIKLRNLSESSSTWIWYMGDPNQTTIPTNRDTSITFTYNTPGTYFLKLYGADSIYNSITGNYYYCSHTYPDTPVVKKVIVQPIPKASFLMPDKLCKGELFEVINTSDTTYKAYRWDMDNGDFINAIKDTNQYVYNTAGTYDIVFTPFYQVFPPYKLCLDTARKSITIYPIEAEFIIDPSSVEPYFSFINQSQSAVKYLWDFGHPSSGDKNHSEELNPTHNYRNSKGKFTVCLIAWNDVDCPDTFCRDLENYFEPRIDIPNVFTPEGKDTLNNRFDIDIFGELQYHLRIYNRWGELMFESKEDGMDNSDSRNWNGRKFNTGEKCPSGVYYVVFHYELNGYDPTVYRGSLTLLRNENE